MMPSPELLARLSRVDTPTICNALELVVPERRAKGFTIRPFVVAQPELGPIVGFARTATIRAREPTSRSAAAMKALRLDYYRYVAAVPGTPTVVVIQDLDDPPGFGAFWGEVNTAVHKGLGCLGCITNGSIRDLASLAPGFQLLAGSVGPSHAWVHVEAFGVDVEVHGMSVRHGDLVHADRHGAVVIPLEAAERLPEAIELCARREAPILTAARAPGFTVEKLAAAWAEAEDIH
ncbi:MAG: RraA family protein [Geminicoccaceae bacterium]|nr:RraA family protein [Geminicoccaceae bacterium]MCS7269350.1 RraA family protein [Geminicoccaceae bacterium]MDW8126106.1 RraA family protein [Geminicoccaceae bacterium]MDW8340789.1 RraA family protein [Geminicoccaceae bacterium]